MRDSEINGRGFAGFRLLQDSRIETRGERGSGVGGTVVDDDDFELFFGVIEGQDRAELGLDEGRSVVNWEDDGNERFGHFRGPDRASAAVRDPAGEQRVAGDDVRDRGGGDEKYDGRQGASLAFSVDQNDSGGEWRVEAEPQSIESAGDSAKPGGDAVQVPQEEGAAKDGSEAVAARGAIEGAEIEDTRQEWIAADFAPEFEPGIVADHFGFYGNDPAHHLDDGGFDGPGIAFEQHQVSAGLDGAAQAVERFAPLGDMHEDAAAVDVGGAESGEIIERAAKESDA